MSDSSKSRSLTPEELAVITAIVGGSGHPTGRTHVEGCLAGAAASNQTNWIVDIKTRSDAPATDLPHEPFPGRAFVSSDSAYQGEVIVWVEGGRLSGLEYAWITDAPPTRWPRPNEMEVVGNEAS
jgi:hypothetical protein